LKRAALLIKEIAGGEISSEVIDVYPDPKEKTQVALKYHFLKKLSGKNYHPDTIKKILQALGFEIDKEGIDDIRVTVPFSKPDISLPADIVEEIMRIDGLDNIEIPSAITISPSVEHEGYKHAYKEKIANHLAAIGFNEIFTNSITNAAYFDEKDLVNAVRLLNNLSVMRPSMLETGLEAVAYNLNRKNNNLQLFEFGKTYLKKDIDQYEETHHLCLYLSGSRTEAGWKQKAGNADFYLLKGQVTNILKHLGITEPVFNAGSDEKHDALVTIHSDNTHIGIIGIVSKTELNRFDIKQPVFFADLNWDVLMNIVSKQVIKFRELPKQLPVYRDLSIVLPRKLEYGTVEKTILQAKVQKLTSINLFDVFESEKLGADKKSFALSFTFLDDEKTMTDKEIDSMMGKIMSVLEKELQAEIRK
jgi:phenylalanyl-tRNA synthetase beta chain